MAATMAASPRAPQLSSCPPGTSAGPSQGLSAGGSSWTGRGSSVRVSAEARRALGGVSSSNSTAASASRSTSTGRISGGSCRHSILLGSGREAWKPRGLGRNEGMGSMGSDDFSPPPMASGGQQQNVEFPKLLARQIFRYDANSEDEKPVVKVRLTVEYKCHSRQMLCIGGSNIPFGWSFLSIAKVPMSWTEGHFWVTEVRPAPPRLSLVSSGAPLLLPLRLSCDNVAAMMYRVY